MKIPQQFQKDQSIVIATFLEKDVTESDTKELSGQPQNFSFESTYHGNFLSFPCKFEHSHKLHYAVIPTQTIATCDADQPHQDSC